jgi:hypothetical protein
MPLAAPGPPLNTTSNGRASGDSSAGWKDQNRRARPVKRGARSPWWWMAYPYGAMSTKPASSPSPSGSSGGPPAPLPAAGPGTPASPQAQASRRVQADSQRAGDMAAG